MGGFWSRVLFLVAIFAISMIGDGERGIELCYIYRGAILTRGSAR